MEIEFKKSVLVDGAFRMRIKLDDGTEINIPAMKREELDDIYKALEDLLKRKETKTICGGYHYDRKRKRLVQD